VVSQALWWKWAHLPKAPTIHLRRARAELILGLKLADSEIEDILTRLGMQLTATDDGWDVVAPSYRFDMAIESDLIEELARIYGYERGASAKCGLAAGARG